MLFTSARCAMVSTEFVAAAVAPSSTTTGMLGIARKTGQNVRQSGWLHRQHDQIGARGGLAVALRGDRNTELARQSLPPISAAPMLPASNTATRFIGVG